MSHTSQNVIALDENNYVHHENQSIHAIIRSKMSKFVVRFGMHSTHCRWGFSFSAFPNIFVRKIPENFQHPPTSIDKSETCETNDRMYAEIRDILVCVFEHFGDTWRKAKLRPYS